MDALRPDLPADIFDINIIKFSLSDVNIAQFVLMMKPRHIRIWKNGAKIKRRFRK